MEKIVALLQNLQQESMALYDENVKMREKVEALERNIDDRFQELAVLTSIIEESQVNTLSENGKGYFKYYLEFMRSRIEDYRMIILSDKHSVKYFDETWYLNTYPEVKDSEYEPFEHYIFFGGLRDYNPSPYFNTKWYLDSNPDVAMDPEHPLFHFLNFGQTEGRSPIPETVNNEVL